MGLPSRSIKLVEIQVLLEPRITGVPELGRDKQNSPNRQLVDPLPRCPAAAAGGLALRRADSGRQLLKFGENFSFETKTVTSRGSN